MDNVLAPDMRDLVNEVKHECECGSRFFQPQWIAFEDWKISAYSLYMTCIECGAEALAPTEIDDPEFIR